MSDPRMEIVLAAKNITGEAFSKVQKDINGLTGSVSSLKTGLGGAAIAAGFTVVATAATAAAMAISTEFIPAASDLQEMQSKFDVVFAGQTQLINEWSENIVDNYAMSAREAKQYLASIQDLLVPMGMQATAAAKLSTEIVRLAADLGSFNNMPTAQVMENIQSALVGEYETMKKYGVVINETRVQQEALNIGLAKTKDKLTAADKAQAAYSLIVKSSAAAMGDMDRTADGYANTTKRLSAEWEDFSAVLGEKFLPAASSVKGFFADILDSITKTLKPDGLPEYIKKLQELRLESEKTRGSKDPYVSIFATKTSDQIAILEAKIGELNFALKESRMFESGIMAGKTTNAPAVEGGLSETEKTSQKKQAEDRKKALESIRQEYDRLTISTVGSAYAEKQLADLKVDQWYQDQLKILKSTTPELEKVVALTRLRNQQEYDFQNRYSNIGMTWDDSDLTPEKILENTAASDQANRARIKSETERMLDEYFGDLERMEDEAQKTSASTFGYITNAFAGSANNFSSSLNDMIWDMEFFSKETVIIWAKMLTQMLLQKNAIEPFLKFTVGSDGGSGIVGKAISGVATLLSGFGGSSQNLLGRGSRASGGPVDAGGLYEVNENGPELFFSKGKQFLMVGDTPGYVKPSHDSFSGLLGGGSIWPISGGAGAALGQSSSTKESSQQITYNINIAAVDARSFSDLVKNNPGSIVSVVNDAMTGNTTLRQTMRGTV